MSLVISHQSLVLSPPSFSYNVIRKKEEGRRKKEEGRGKKSLVISH
ncbi:hypothetical protein IQ269_18360 [Tychonema sp. LEGE 07199]|nr:hypothetical protein [Tychonema sp. LEGE 07199]MBE9122710.1 hypothetical protein [Tychonema sp. LEGE 07199]